MMLLDNAINNIVNEVLQEKISRQQKEAGAKAMDGINFDPFTQLKRAFNWRWKNGAPEKLTYQDLYKIGTYDKYGHSIDRINNSIKKEKEHFGEEINYFPY